jgi:predicted amidophosphoribosyltransferase
MVTCQDCGGRIPDDGRFCPYCGKPRSYLIRNYDLPTNVSNEAYQTSRAISTYFTTGSVAVAAAQEHPDSPFLDFGARNFKTKWASIPIKFAQKIIEGEEATRNETDSCFDNFRTVHFAC